MDAAFGFGAPTWADISGFFTGLFASGLPPDAISYALRVVGDEHGAVVELIDTPEFFNLDLRVLSRSPSTGTSRSSERSTTG